MNRVILTATLLIFISTPAFAMRANPDAGGQQPHRHNPVDTNGDGAIDQAEFAARAQQRQQQLFTKLDTNHDGKISRDEMAAARGRKGSHGSGNGPR